MGLEFDVVCIAWVSCDACSREARISTKQLCPQEEAEKNALDDGWTKCSLKHPVGDEKYFWLCPGCARKEAERG
jgi:hypothetical protein